MENEFLPKGFKIPKESGRYAKIKQGANKFRILSAPILGSEAWTSDNKPRRVRMGEKMPLTNLKPDTKIKHFWAMPVYNYTEKKIQILEITQSGIQETIQEYANNEDWGSPLEYDITITRKGEKLVDTEYTVTVSPKKELHVMIQGMWNETKKKGFDLNKMFTNDDPFGEGDTPQEPTQEEVEKAVDDIPF